MNHPLSRDGCTGLWRQPPWDGCCAQHDKDYWAGVIGETASPTRLEADAKLYQCIKAAGYPKTAWAAWAIVRALGWVSWRRHARRHRG